MADRVCPFCADPVIAVMNAGSIRMWLHQAPEWVRSGGEPVLAMDRWVHSTEVS